MGLLIRRPVLTTALAPGFRKHVQCVQVGLHPIAGTRRVA